MILTIIKIVAILLLCLGFLVKEALVITLISLIFASIFDLWVNFLQCRRWSHAFGVSLVSEDRSVGATNMKTVAGKSLSLLIMGWWSVLSVANP